MGPIFLVKELCFSCKRAYHSCKRALHFLETHPIFHGKRPKSFLQKSPTPICTENTQCSATLCNALQHTAAHCSTLQDSAPDYTDVCVQHPQDYLLSRTQAPKTWRTLSQATASHVSCVQNPQHTKTHCNTLQHCNSAHCHRQPQVMQHKVNIRIIL